MSDEFLETSCEDKLVTGEVPFFPGRHHFKFLDFIYLYIWQVIMKGWW